MNKYHFLASCLVLLIGVTAAQAQSWDGYIHLYENSFDPVDQLTNLIDGDDDGPGGIGTSQLADVTLSPGVQYILVTSGFETGVAGPYVNMVSGPGTTRVLNGDTTDGPLWDRPVAGGPMLFGEDVNYSADMFMVDTTGLWTIDSLQDAMVPEPSSLGLLILGLVALFSRRQR